MGLYTFPNRQAEISRHYRPIMDEALALLLLPPFWLKCLHESFAQFIEPMSIYCAKSASCDENEG